MHEPPTGLVHDAAPQCQRVLERIGDDTAASFIHRALRVLPGTHSDLSYLLARFRPEHFQSTLFAHHGIDFPAHIRNSVTKRQAEFIAGRLCAQAILAAYGLEQQPVGIGSQREPLWPPGFVGSITHNGHYAAAIACPAATLLGLGIDIESVIQDEARQAMVDLVVSRAEADLLRAAAGELSFECLLTLVFSAKESFFKAAFAQVRAFVDFDAVNVEAIDVARRVIALRCRTELSEYLYAGRRFYAHFDFLDMGAIFTVVVLQNETLAQQQAPRCDSTGTTAPLS